MAILSQLFTPEELARDLKLHELSPEEQEMLRRAIGAELRDAAQSVKDALRNRVRQVHAHMRPPTTP
jgi:DNA-binding protein YbaB